MAITRFPLETDQPVIEVTLPPGRHVLELVVEDSAGLLSEPDTVTITVENVLPVISGINPAAARRGSEGVTAVITGTNLVNVQEVRFLGGGITVNRFTETGGAQLEVVLTVAPDAALGPQGFRVTTADGSVESPAGVTFAIQQGLPVIIAINPVSGRQGDTNLTLTIGGRYLEDVQKVTFLDVGGVGDIEIGDLRERSPEALEVVVSIGPEATPGQRSFRVTTSEGSAQSPAGVAFTVVQSARPEISGIVPGSGILGSRNLSVVIQGNNLVDVRSVEFEGSGITVRDFSERSERELEVFLDIDITAATGDRGFAVRTGSDAVKSPPDVVFLVTAREIPTIEPTIRPTIVPTISPTIIPTVRPTISPTFVPTISPTFSPTISPTIIPTITPTFAPTISPTIIPTVTPTIVPTISPTIFRVPGGSILSPGVAPATPGAGDSRVRSVQEVKGIGPATAERLKTRDITSLADLASMEPGKLGEILGISEVRAMAFIDEARRLLTEEG